MPNVSIGMNGTIYICKHTFWEDSKCGFMCESFHTVRANTARRDCYIATNSSFRMDDLDLDCFLVI